MVARSWRSFYGSQVQPGSRPGQASPENALSSADPQQVVHVHDPDRPAGVDHDQRRDLGGIEHFERLARKLVGPHRLRVPGHDVVDPGGEQVGRACAGAGRRR